jgi:hypothetical protein
MNRWIQAVTYLLLLVASLLPLLEQKAMAGDDTPLAKLWVKSDTTDDKDRGDAVKFEIFDKDGRVIADSDFVGREIVWRDGKGVLWMFETWSKRKDYKIKFKPSECSVLKPKLVITKNGGNGAFKASFKVIGWTDRDTPYLLMDATPQAVFGKRLQTHSIPGGIGGGWEEGPLTQSWPFTCSGELSRGSALTPF